jgi:tRNA A37 threonylcarbamoyladenosine dehydratase
MRDVRPGSRLLLAAAAVVISSLSAWVWRRRLRPQRAASGPAGDARDQPLVVVVGLGGVGSHAAHLLLRSGVRRLRLIDFDQVTLSSLNRHATATRLDVGTPKATALRAALLAIDAGADIEARVSLFCAEAAADLLCGGPALVVDAIDDIKTKAELQVFCVRAGLRVLSALGAGGKADCTSLLVAPLADVLGDPVAGGLFKQLKMETAAELDGHWWDALEHRVECVYSSERQVVGLLPMPEGVSAAELGSQPTFRARVLPVLPPVPAAFGAALASRALELLPGGGRHVPPPAIPAMTVHFQRRLHVHFENEFVLGKGKRDKAARKAAKNSSRDGGAWGETNAPQGRGAEAQAGKKEKRLAEPSGPAAGPPGGDAGWAPPSTWPVSFDEAGILMRQVFRGRRAQP